MKECKKVMLTIGWYYERLVHGVIDYARSHNWHLLLQHGSNLKQDLLAWNGDGVIAGHAPELLDCRSWDNMPLVSLVKIDNPKIEYLLVRENDYKIGVIAAEFFLKRGYRNFAYYSQSMRALGYSETLRHNGIDNIFSRETLQPIHTIVEWLKKLPKPCALFCENDWDASDVINTALFNGIRIPSELAVLGSGNDDLICNAPKIAISSIATGYYRLGFKAAAELDNIMDGNQIPATPILIQPEALVIERQSADAFAVDSPKILEIMGYIKEHAASDITIRKLAKHFSMAESTMYKLFIVNLGISPKAFLNEARLKLACSKLLVANQTMDAIAEQSGFPTTCAFFSAFRKNFNTTPTEWRTVHYRRGR